MKINPPPLRPFRSIRDIWSPNTFPGIKWLEFVEIKEILTFQQKAEKKDQEIKMDKRKRGQISSREIR